MSQSFASRTDFVVAKLQEQSPDSILDVGFIGEYKDPFIHAALLKNFPDSHVTGIDMNDKIKTYVSDQRRRYVQKSVFDLDKDVSFKGLFAGVVFCEVFEHLHQPYAALHQLHAVLQPGGVLVMTWPNPLSFTIFMRYLRQRDVGDKTFLKSYLGADDHKIFPMPPCMVAYLNSIGFTNIEVHFLKGRMSRWPMLNKFSSYVGISAKKAGG